MSLQAGLDTPQYIGSPAFGLACGNCVFRYLDKTTRFSPKIKQTVFG